jgi:23S rRNA pseudouridine2605 synthase
MEGRNREVRRLWESQGLHRVAAEAGSLRRSCFCPSKLKKGQWQELEAREAAVLYRMAGPDAQGRRRNADPG